MSNWDLGAGLCLALHLTEINTEVSIPLNPVLPCVMGKWDCCIANWCSLVNCREETGEAGIRKVTEPGLKHIQIWKCRVPDPRSWLYYSKLQQRVRMGLLSQFWGWADYEGLEWELVWENECILSYTTGQRRTGQRTKQQCERVETKASANCADTLIIRVPTYCWKVDMQFLCLSVVSTSSSQRSAPIIGKGREGLLRWVDFFMSDLVIHSGAVTLLSSK